MHIDDVIKEIKLRAENRTRYVGQPPFIEELIVAEIDKLRAEIERLRTERDEATLAANVLWDFIDGRVGNAPLAQWRARWKWLGDAMDCRDYPQ